jgi:hypothetical protein
MVWIDDALSRVERVLHDLVEPGLRRGFGHRASPYGDNSGRILRSRRITERQRSVILDANGIGPEGARPREHRRDRTPPGGAMTQLAAYGIGIQVPNGWDGRILRRRAADSDERSRAVVHIASFPMPEGRGDFGVGVTELMRSGDAYITLFEYGPESLGTPLFATEGVPRLTVDLFTSRRLRRTRPGQVGCQLFFTANRRPFCLDVVVSGRLHLRSVIPQMNRMLQALDLTA